MNPERRSITFSGRVQGVGFRITTVHLARNLPLAGTVRNLPDGSVHLLVQGAPADIDALIQRLREHYGAFIRTIGQETQTPEPDAPTGIRIAP